MLTDSPPDALELLVVGGLTVDRFADGSSAPGGSVLHAARAVARRGLRVGVATAAGPEDEARAGIAELRRITSLLEVTESARTATFRHRDTPDGRRLWFEAKGSPVALGPGAALRILTHSILYAPVAGEIDPAALVVWPDDWARGAVLQGWLREPVGGAEISHRPLSALSTDTREALATMDVLVASREDLGAEERAPFRVLTRLRAFFGRRPVLVVTDGAHGLWVDEAGLRAGLDWREHVAVPWVVEGVPDVGAGDVLAAFVTMKAHYPEGGWPAHLERAMRVVAEELAARRQPQ